MKEDEEEDEVFFSRSKEFYSWWLNYNHFTHSLTHHSSFHSTSHERRRKKNLTRMFFISFWNSFSFFMLIIAQHSTQTEMMMMVKSGNIFLFSFCCLSIFQPFMKIYLIFSWTWLVCQQSGCHKISQFVIVSFISFPKPLKSCEKGE